MNLDFSRCRDVWVPEDNEAGGFWSPPPPHVRYGVEQIVQNPWFFLCDDMGGMKTAQAIISAQFLHDAGEIDRVIVVAPASVRPKVWFDKDLGQLHEQIFKDKRNTVTEFHQKVKQWSEGPETAQELRWIITNYEFIRSKKNLTELLPYCTLKTMLILDESSAVRTHDSAQTEACKMLRWKTNSKGYVVLGAPRCGRILELNGTPVAESPMDLFSQANLLHPDILECRYITYYKARYAVQEAVLGTGGKKITDPRGNDVKKVVGWTNIEDLQKRLAPYVLRREAKDLGINFALPPVALEVRLTEATWKIYREMRDELVVWLETNDVATAATAAVKTIRLAQITSGFLGGVEDAGIDEEENNTEWDYDDLPFKDADTQSYKEGGTRFKPFKEGDVLDLPGSFLDGLKLQAGGAKALNRQARELAPTVEIGREKLDFALTWHKELLEHRPNLKLLTWCRFVPELKRYLEEVQQFGHPIGAACGQAILGGTKRAEREHALRLLHPKTAPAGPCTVGATQGTGAIGLNFTACRTVLDMSYDFSPWKKKQGDARVNRPGQTGPVSFFYLIAVGPKGQKTIDHHVMMTRLGKMQINDLTQKAWVKLLLEE
jgi:hypothetical protein